MPVAACNRVSRFCTPQGSAWDVTRGQLTAPSARRRAPGSGWVGGYRFYELVESLEPSALCAKIGMRLGVGPTCGAA